MSGFGGSTKTVGGGAATGLSNDFIRFLQHGLNTGSYTGYDAANDPGNRNNYSPGKRPRGSDPRNNNGPTDLFGSSITPNYQFGQTDAGSAYGNSNPIDSTQGVGGVMDKFLYGDFGDQSYKVDSPYSFKDYDFSTNLPDYSKFNTDRLANFNVDMSGIPAYAPGVSTNPLFQSALRAASQSSRLPEFQTSPINSPGVAAASNLLDRKQARDIADLRARFGYAGGGGLGSGASYAEGNYRAESGAQNAAALADIARSDSALKLQGELGAGQINTDRLKFGGSQATSMADLISRTLLGEESNKLAARAQDIDAKLRSGQLTLDAISQATGLNLEALKAATAQGISVGQLVNENERIKSSYDTDYKRTQLGYNELNEGARRTNLGAQGAFLQSLLDLYARLSQSGIPQAQTVEEPGFFDQLLKGASSVGTIYAGL